MYLEERIYCAASIQDFLGHESFDFKNGRRASEDQLIVYDREIIPRPVVQRDCKCRTQQAIFTVDQGHGLLKGSVCGRSAVGGWTCQTGESFGRFFLKGDPRASTD